MRGMHIEVKNLSLTRGNRPILQAVNLQVEPGEIVCLLGPSGSGKSSLLRGLNLLTDPPPQTIFLNKQDITGLNVLTVRHQMGMVFQQAVLFPSTVADNLGYGPALREQSLTEAEMIELLALSDLEAEFLYHQVDTLSGGQAQRVSLARTLANQSEALLLDEPTSALDPLATRHIEETVLNLRHNLGLTVLWVTHDIEQVSRVADRVYLLVEGRVVDEGTPAHLLRPDSRHLTAAFAAGALNS